MSWTDANTGRLVVFCTTAVENRVVITRIWNQVRNFGTGCRYPVSATNYYQQRLITQRPNNHISVDSTCKSAVSQWCILHVRPRPCDQLFIVLDSWPIWPRCWRSRLWFESCTQKFLAITLKLKAQQLTTSELKLKVCLWQQ